MTRRRTFEVAILCLAITLPVRSAEAKAFRYRSHHPLQKTRGSFCYLEVPHVHGFGPQDPRLYRMIDGELYFIGDPAPFGYDGDRYSYYGAHPVVDVHVGSPRPVYCYLDGPHYHSYEPPASAEFQVHGGAYFYLGTFQPAFREERPRYVAINEVYRPIVYARPVVDISIVPADVRARVTVLGPPVRARGHVVASPVGANLHVGLGIHLGGPVVHERVIVQEPVHHHRVEHYKVKHYKVKHYKVKHHKVKHHKH